jgi:NitT/TauT family transport system substrate-binding protein
MSLAFTSRLSSFCRRVATGAVSAVFAASIAASASAADLTTVRLQLDWLPTGYHAPIFLALEKGYYRDAGIDLQIIDGQGTNSALQAAASGNADIVLANYATMIQSVASGMDLLAVGGLIQRLPDAIVSLASDPITEPKQLEGTTIATTPGDAAAKLLPAFLQAAKVDASKVNVLSTAAGQTATAVLSGSAKSMPGWSFTDALIVASKKPIAKPILWSDYGINILGVGFVTTKSYAGKNADVVKAFMAATAKGYAEGLADPDAAINAMVAQRPLVDKGLQLAQLKGFPPFVHSAKSEGKPFGWTSKEDWVQTDGLLKKYFDMKGSVDVAKLYSNDYVAAK